MKYLSTITFVFSFCIGFCQLGEEVGPLTGNPALQSKAKLTDLQKANPGINKKLSNAPKMSKKGNKVAKTDVYTKQKKRLKSSGKLTDAVDVFKNFI